jgi:hypothetical protein
VKFEERLSRFTLLILHFPEIHMTGYLQSLLKRRYVRSIVIMLFLAIAVGVDYAAATGTPVQAVGNGVVTVAGYGGGGNTVRLRHSNGYETSYMHLSRIAVRNGARVSQGQVIGYVGATGLATGPHLDFRVYKSGLAVNPLKVISPPGDPVSPSQFARFTQLCDALRAQLHSESLPQEARNKNVSGTMSELSRNK